MSNKIYQIRFEQIDRELRLLRDMFKDVFKMVGKNENQEQDREYDSIRIEELRDEFEEDSGQKEKRLDELDKKCHWMEQTAVHNMTVVQRDNGEKFGVVNRTSDNLHQRLQVLESISDDLGNRLNILTSGLPDGSKEKAEIVK